MATAKQKNAAARNIKKARATWKSMTSRQRSLAQPQGRKRAKPGTRGEGRYYRVVVRPKEEFATFRYHDVGEPGEIQRLSGKRSSGSWADQAWLISKDMAHVEGDRLIADSPEARQILNKIGPARRMKEDVFQGHPRRNIPEREKPTPTQRRARTENIRKAQETRRRS